MKKFAPYLFVLTFLAISIPALAGAPPPPPPPGCWPPPCVPIDGGITFLLIAGAAYGSKKVYDLKNHKTNP